MALFNLPNGVFDILPEEYYNLELIKDKLKACFTKSGCEFIKTPGIEYFDNFTKIKGKIMQEKMFKMSDNDGKLLVVRPDITLSTARIAATKLSGTVNKLCYFSSVYEANADGVNSREVSQAGVEFLGINSSFADAECIALAIESLISAGLDDFIIDIGHIGFFKGLLADSGLSDEQIENIRRFVNRKDLLSASLILKDSQNHGIIDSIMQLPLLFGGEEAIEKALKLTKNKQSLAALENLSKVYKLLCDFGYEKYISIDLGTVKSLSYYSGILFTGLCKNIGSAVLTGGRYDNLAAEFGKDIPAVGFAIGLKRLMTVLERQGKLVKKPPSDRLIAAEKGSETECYLYAKKLREQGQTVEIFNGKSDLAKIYAEQKGIKNVKIFKGNLND